MSAAPPPPPLRLGIAGLGGYARSILRLVLQRVDGPGPRIKLAAVCDPFPQQHSEVVADLEHRGVRVYDDYAAMLEHPELEAVWLPVPINLHVPFTRQALAAGKAVMLEKPVCGTLEDVDGLIEARDAAGLPVLVGFQDIYDRSTLRLKRHLLAEDLGPLQRSSLRCCWPRTQGYFTRNAWAGRVRHGEDWILDSPLNNAMAHFVNLVLFLLGPTEAESAVPVRIAAELYRAAEIENFDTASLRLEFADQPPFLANLTHAAATVQGPVIDLIGSRGRITRTPRDYHITVDGQSQVHPVEAEGRQDVLECLVHGVRGQPTPDRAWATLEVARSHTLTVNAASQAAAVVAVPAEYRQTLELGDSTVQAIPDIERIFERCAERDRMLHESGALAFTRPAGCLDLRDYRRFAGLAQ